jgi:hypothetical protein
VPRSRYSVKKNGVVFLLPRGEEGLSKRITEKVEESEEKITVRCCILGPQSGLQQSAGLQ